jgi:prephenate dehydrogenase
MQWPLQNLTIVGVGLIGGSIGLAAKKRGLAVRIRGVGRDAAKLDTARKLGAIDDCHLELHEAVRDADLVVFCTPVSRIATQIHQAADHCRAGTLLTDAGSTKRDLVQAVEANLSPNVRFVGAHPLAGSEKKGADFADADLFVDRWTVLTPTEKTPVTAVEEARSFWQSLGSRVRLMSPEDHDRALALTSHLPHLVAAALAGILPENMRDLTATGFRDTTRVAGGDPEVWTPIFQHNRAAVLSALVQLVDRLDKFRQALASNETATIDQLLTQGKKVRDALGS